MTVPWESSGVKALDGRRITPGRTGTGGRAITRAVASEHRKRREMCFRRQPVSGVLEEPTHCSNEEGHGSRDLSGHGTCFSSRRRGDGTCERSTDPKQGRSRWQPIPGRRAKASGITNVLGKAGGAIETGGSGRSSDEERDNRTLSERRARGPRWLLKWPEAGPVENTG